MSHGANNTVQEVNFVSVKHLPLPREVLLSCKIQGFSNTGRDAALGTKIRLGGRWNYR